MNLYITTTALNDGIIVSTSEARSKSVLWKKSLLDLAIKTVEENPNLTLKEIIVPERLTSIDSFKGYPIQKIKTVIDSSHPDYKISKYFHNQLVNKNEFEHLIENNEVLHIRNLRIGLHSNIIPWSDNEHQILFEKMKLEFPCIIIDGDVIITKLNKIPNKSCLLDTGRIFLMNEYDKNNILLNINKHKINSNFIESYHLNDYKMYSLLKLGYKFDNIKNDLVSAGYTNIR